MTAHATDAGAQQAHHAPINAILAAQVDAWNRGDAPGFAARALPDVVFTNIVGMFSVGREPFIVQHQRIFATIYRGSRLAQSLVQITLARPDVAIVDTLTTLTGYATLPPGMRADNDCLRTRLEQVMVCNDGAWWVAAFHNVAVNAALPPGTD